MWLFGYAHSAQQGKMQRFQAKRNTKHTEKAKTPPHAGQKWKRTQPQNHEPHNSRACKYKKDTRFLNSSAERQKKHNDRTLETNVN